MASGIYIKPSKRGTFTAAAKSHGKSVQGFASQVLANKDNYSPAMVKKANFARNATGWNKETGGILPIYGCGGSMKKEMGGELMMLDQYGFGSWLKENGAGLLKGAGSLVSMIPGIGQIAGPVLSTAGSVIGGIQQKNAQQDAAQAEADAMAASQAEQQRVQDLETRRTNVVDQKQISYAPTFATGGKLVAMFENGGKIPVAVAPLLQQKLQLGDTLKGGKSKVTSSEVKKYRDREIKKGIEVEREHTDDPATAVEIAMDHLEEFPDYYTRLDKMEKTAKKAHGMKMAMGGNLMMGGGQNQLQINDYTNGNTHDEGVGGIPVDARGNPATTSKSSVVGLTEKGEVTWNGYVFSDKIKIS